MTVNSLHETKQHKSNALLACDFNAESAASQKQNDESRVVDKRSIRSYSGA